MRASKHALDRIQQRGIPPLILHWLFDYGSTQYQGNGATILYFDRTSKRRLERTFGRRIVKRLSEYLDCYAVVADDTLVTTGKRYKRIKVH